MRRPTHILAVLDRGHLDTRLVAKAAHIAAQCGARLELFLCDAEHAYAMKHEYDASRNVEFRRDCLHSALAYLGDVRSTVKLPDHQVAISAACESPLYEGVVRKVQQSRADLVIKAASESAAGAQPVFDSNDWQLMRKCPVTLMLTRGRIWRAQARIAAAVDVSADETVGLPKSILTAAQTLCSVQGCDLEVLYSMPTDASGEIRHSSESMLQYLARNFNIGHESVHVLDGQPEDTLPRFVAEKDYDAIVMGALSHRPAAVTPVGTLTSKLMDSLDCDFVLVKAEHAA
jgi:universal stress protein E